MPTLEERLKVVEDKTKLTDDQFNAFKTDAIQAYQEYAMDLTIVKGLSQDSILRLKDLKQDVNQRIGALEHRLGSLDHRLSLVDMHISSIDRHLDKVDQRFDAIDDHLNKVDQQIAEVKQNVRDLQNRFDGLENRFDRLEKLIIDRLPSA